jgi:sugar lactone lactonase YvrE
MTKSNAARSCRGGTLPLLSLLIAGAVAACGGGHPGGGHDGNGTDIPLGMDRPGEAASESIREAAAETLPGDSVRELPAPADRPSDGVGGGDGGVIGDPPDADASSAPESGTNDGPNGGDADAPATGAVDGGDARDRGGPACPPADVDVDGGSDRSQPAPPAPAPDWVAFEPNVTVSTVAGGQVEGAMDGPMGTATFANPVSVVVEAGGTLLVCDFDNNRIRRVDMSGAVSTLTTQNNFSRPFGFAHATDGTVYVDTDYNPSGAKNNLSGTIWRIDATTGAATVVAANLGRPRGLTVLPDGRLVLADYQNARVRLLDPSTGAVTDIAGLAGCPGSADGQGSGARFGVPYAVVVLPDGRLVIADHDNHTLRLLTIDGQLSPFAGDGGVGTIDGPRLSARFMTPNALAADGAGNVYVSDYGAHRIRRVAPNGTVTTIAGDGTEGFNDGAGAQSRFYGQEGIAVTADGKTLFVADGTRGESGPYHRIRKIALGP